MGKSNFQYDETGNTYSYVALTFLGLILIPSTIYWWPKKEKDDKDKKKKYIQACAEGTSYWQACAEKAHRMQKKDPWAKTRRSVGAIFLLIGWGLFGMIAYQASQFDYEMANFDPYEILQVQPFVVNALTFWVLSVVLKISVIDAVILGYNCFFKL